MSESRANRYISVIYRYGRRFFAAQLRERGLPAEAGDLPFLLQTYYCPGLTQDGIAQNLGMDKGTTARSLARMEESGLIRRESGETDRRCNHIYPTELALSLREQVFEIIIDLHKVLYQGFSAEEIESALDMLTRMKDNIAEYIDNQK